MPNDPQDTGGGTHSRQETLIRRALGLFGTDEGAALSALREGLDEARAAGDLVCCAWALNVLADIEARNGRGGRARELAEEALDCGRKSGDARTHANALDGLGMLEQRDGRVSAAIVRYQQSLELRKTTGRDKDIAFSASNLSLAYRELGDFARAVEFQHQALATRERLGDAAGAATSYLNLGVLHVDLGDWDKALEFYFRALAEHERRSDRGNMAICYNNIGEVYLNRGRLDRAEFYLDRALAAATEAGPAWVQAEVLGSMGEAAAAAGDAARAEALYERDRKLCEEHDCREELVETLRRWAELEVTQGRLLAAGTKLEQALRQCSDAGLRREAGCVHRAMGELALARGDVDGAAAVLRQSVEELRRLGRNYDLGLALMSYGRLLAGAGQGELELEEARAIFQDLGAVRRAEEASRLLAGRIEGAAPLEVLPGLTTLAAGDTDAAEFCTAALDLLVPALHASAGAVILRDGRVVQKGQAVKDDAAGVTVALEAGGRRLGTLVLNAAVEGPRLRAPAEMVALGLAQREQQPARAPVEPEEPGGQFPEVVGADTTLREVFDTVGRVAGTRAGVLILGESGTGKEVVARILHRLSNRKDQPFVAVNCAAIPETLLESELFGIEKGTATGVSERKGRFEGADKGTLFLDEVGDMSLGLQAKMLRVLQDYTFERVGGRRPVSVDVRVVAATSRDLEAAIGQGQFRRDLFYRLNVITLSLPPLRERRQDIPALARRLANRFASEYGKDVKGVGPGCLDCLVAHDWPGNVRELENVVERGVILARGELLGIEDLPPALQRGAGATAWRAVTKPDRIGGPSQRQAVLAALEATAWNVSRAAARLGVSRRQLHRVIAKLGLTRPQP